MSGRGKRPQQSFLTRLRKADLAGTGTTVRPYEVRDIRDALEAARSQSERVGRLEEALCRMVAAYRELRVLYNINGDQREHFEFALEVLGSDDDDWGARSPLNQDSSNG